VCVDASRCALGQSCTVTARIKAAMSGKSFMTFLRGLYQYPLCVTPIDVRARDSDAGSSHPVRRARFLEKAKMRGLLHRNVGFGGGAWMSSYIIRV
jgi:hypothetical protein